MFLKLIAELIESKDLLDHLALTCVMGVSVGISGAVQLHMLNLAMKYYDQIEAIPIYQTAVMIMWILTGLVVFNEAKFYSKLELYGIMGSITLCCIGIKFLTMKTKMLRAVRRNE